MTKSIFDTALLLPGLKLKEITGSIPDNAFNKDPNAGPPVIVCLKHCDKSLKFIQGKKPVLLATFTGGIEEVENVEEAEKEIEETDDDESVSLDDDEIPEYVNPLEEVEEVYEEKIISSIAGYHCFVIYPEKEWNFKDKDIQTISLDILLSENDADIKNDENSKVITVGETFIIDYEAMSSEPNKALFLEWDLSCALMEQVSSPENTKLITSESDVPSEALCLGLSGMKKLEPFEPLKMYVRMNDLDNNSDFTFKIYGLTKDLPTMKKDLDTVLEEAITKASSSTSLYEGPGNGNQDFLELEVSAEDFLSLVKTSMDKDTSDEDEELAYASAVEKGSEEADNDDVETINEAIKKSRFYVTIEDSSNTFVAKFLLSDIKSNSLYFDSAVQALKRAESSDWSEAKVVEWSEMAMLTSRSEWNSIQETSTKYKVKRFESIPLLEKPKDVDGSVQTFELNVELPKTVSASNSNLVDPNHISILVQNTDTDISFMGKGSSHRFLYLTDPMEDVNVTEKGDFLKFEWTCINHSSASRDISINVSVLLKPSPVDEMIRIGTTVSYSKHIQEESKKHITGLRLRNMIGLGLAETNSIKHSFSNFFDAFFRILFSLSDFNKRKFSKSLINKAAMDISDDFYQEITGEESLVILNLIKDSVIFSSGPDAPSTGVDEVVEFLGTLLPLVAVKTEEFRRWSFSLLDDEDFFGLLEEDDMIDLSSVIVLEPQEIKERLNGYSQVTEGFIVAGKIVRDEIDEMLGVEGSHRLDLNPDDLLESTISEIDTLSDVPIESQIQIMESASETPLNHMSKILRSLGKREMEQFKAASSKTSLESQIMKFMGKGEMKKLEVKSDEIAVEARGLMLNTTIASTSDIKMASDDDLEKMESNLTEMLTNAQESCDMSKILIEESVSFINDITSPLDRLDDLASYIEDIKNSSTSLNNSVKGFWRLAQILSRVAIGPLAPLKAIITGMKYPMKILLKALEKGKKSIKSIHQKFTAKLKNVTKKKDKIDGLSSTLEKPVTALEKISEIISTLISVSSFGVIPMSLISKFSESKDLESFLNVLKNNMDKVKSVFNNFLTQINVMNPLINKVQDFVNDVRSKTSVLQPLQNILQKLQPFVNKIQKIFDKFLSSWWLRRLLSGVMWPIEKAVNVILYPFRDTIQRVIQKLDPFSAFDQIFNPLLSPLELLPSTATLIGKLDFVESFGISSSFDQITEPMMNIIAIILRGSYGMMSGMLQQSADSVEIFEQMLGGSQSNVMKSFMSLLQEKRNINPLYKMSDLILEIKAEEVDSKVFMCDNYLRANTGLPLSHQDTSVDNTMLRILHNGTKFDILPCNIDVTRDSLTPFFEHGTPANSWFMAPLTLLLHHASITQKAVEAGIISSENEIKTAFVPTVDSNTGKCTVKLFPRVSRTESTTYTTNTNLPISRVTLGNLRDIELVELPMALIDYIQDKISSPVSNMFARNYSWALVEKVVICKVIQGYWDNGSIGTGMHLLGGTTNGICYSKSDITNDWKVLTINDSLGYTHDQYDEVMLTPSLSDFDDDSLFDLLKKRTMSMSQIDILYTLDSESSGSDRSEIEDALQDFSMFIVKKGDRFYPIFYTDETADEDILAVYADGEKIQPLFKNDFKSNSVTEVWEYKVTGDFSIKPQEIRPLNKVLMDSWNSEPGNNWKQIAQSEVVDVGYVTSSSNINVELHFKDKVQPPVDKYKTWLDGESWNDNTWLDKSVNGHHPETHGTIDTGTDKKLKYLHGDTSSGITLKNGWPSGNEYTFFHVTKYNGSNRERIWTGTTGNWLSGHHAGKKGLFHHKVWNTQYSKSVGIADSWGIFTDRQSSSKTNVRVDGVDVTTNSSHKYNPDSIGINLDKWYSARSDWAAAMVLVYDRYLSDDEVKLVEDWIRTHYLPFAQPPVNNPEIWLDGESWNDNTWLDKSVNGHHSETHGTIDTGTDKKLKYLHGDTSSGITLKNGWPSGNEYTFFHVTKYNGSNRERIWTGTTGNWISGHHTGDRGVFFHEGWNTYTSVGIVESWGIFTDRQSSSKTNVRVDGVDMTTNSFKYNPDSIGINPTGIWTDQHSDWAAAMVLVYNRYLSDDEVKSVEGWIRSQYFPQPPVDKYKTWLDGESWNDNTWLDKSVNGHHPETHGTIDTGTDKKLKYLHGDTSSGITLKNGWPSGNEYTFFHVTKYNGSNRERIWTGTTGNWISGHDNGKRGLFHHGGPITQYSKSVGGVESWGIFTDRVNISGSNVRVDGVDVTTNSSHKYIPDSIGINLDKWYSDRSDWAAGMVLVYDRYLSDDEVKLVEDWIRTTYPFPYEVPNEDFVNLALLDKSGEEIANANVGRGSQHSGSKISKTFDFQHDLVKKCKSGFKYVLMGKGGDEENPLRLENIEIKFKNFAFAHSETTKMDVVQTSRSFGIQSIKPVSSGILKRGFVGASPFASIGSVSNSSKERKTSSKNNELSMLGEQSSHISRSILTTNNSGSITLYSMKNTSNGSNNVMTMVMDDLVRSSGVILLGNNNKRYQKGNYVLLKEKNHKGLIQDIKTSTNGRNGRITTYTILDITKEAEEAKKPPKNRVSVTYNVVEDKIKEKIQRKLRIEEEQDALILRKKGLFVRNNGPNRHFQWVAGNNNNTLRQELVPNWGMTLKQFREYVHFCMKYDETLKMPTSFLWYSQASKYDALLKKNKGYVSLEDMNNAFIVPQTKGTGMSVALNMQAQNRYQSAEVMVSHAWREDMYQVLIMLEEAKGTNLKSGKTFGDETVIWFCAFAQYQANDSEGPSVSDQVALDPFSQVIKSDKVMDMFVLQTKSFDPYTRMWCVIELGEALKKQKEGKLKIHPLFSKSWLEEYIVPKEVNLTRRWSTRSGQAILITATGPNFGDGEDFELLRGQRQGFKTDRTKNDIKKYYLIEPGEMGEDPETKGQEFMLKTNVREGLKGYGLHPVARPDDLEVFKKISNRYREGEKFGWEILQEKVVEFQEREAMKVFVASGGGIRDT